MAEDGKNRSMKSQWEIGHVPALLSLMKSRRRSIRRPLIDFSCVKRAQCMASGLTSCVVDKRPAHPHQLDVNLSVYTSIFIPQDW